ncbi:MAG: hypothetical protein LBU12_01325 [Deltaproteobacteria bacterium]|nr:hypothetical protein [Deltaproteobacteria bacterium]
MSTGNNWTEEANSDIIGQAIPCVRLGLAELSEASVGWVKLDQSLFDP